MASRPALGLGPQPYSLHGFAFAVIGGGVVLYTATDFLVNAKLAADGRVQVDSKDTSYNALKVFGGLRHEQAWSACVREGKQSSHDAVVFATGPHWAGTAKNASVFSAMVFAVKEWFARRDYRGLLAYRTNPVPGCGDKEYDRIAAATYRWGMLASFDAIWSNWIKAPSRGPTAQRWSVLDIGGASQYGRGHCDRCHGATIKLPRDCLHYCLPGGPVDVWNSPLVRWLAEKGRMARYGFAKMAVV